MHAWETLKLMDNLPHFIVIAFTFIKLCSLLPLYLSPTHSYSFILSRLFLPCFSPSLIIFLALLSVHTNSFIIKDSIHKCTQDTEVGMRWETLKGIFWWTDNLTTFVCLVYLIIMNTSPQSHTIRMPEMMRMRNLESACVCFTMSCWNKERLLS